MPGNPLLRSLAALLLACTLGACAGDRTTNAAARFEILSDHFVGACYGPYRAGQSPGGPMPTDAQILQDLRIIEKRWSIIRVYSSSEATPAVLRLIDRHDIDVRVVVGAWLACEHAEDLEHITPQDAQQNARRNRREVRSAAELADRYPKIVTAICLGNETQVSWSWHRLRRDSLLQYIRLARSLTDKPLTVADDFTVWADPDSRELASRLDFLIVHIYAAWHGRQLDDAISFTDEKARLVRETHPNTRAIVGEIGWPTSVASSGEQAELIKGRAGEIEQAKFFEHLIAWSRKTRTPVFIFEVFDEPWKGSDDPAEVEKHWGVFRADRTPKPAAAHFGSNP